MAATLDAYLFFTGNCREAMAYYQSIFGGELNIMDVDHDPSKVMHASLSGGVVSLMASDSTRSEPYGDSMIALSISGKDETLLTDTFNALAASGKITVPLAKQFWGDTFGMLVDKYRVDWMVNIGQG